MIRILLIHPRGEPVPASPEGVVLGALELPPSGDSDEAMRTAAEAMRAESHDAVVIVGSGDDIERGRISQLTALLKAAPVPSVLCSPRNLHSLPTPAADTSPMDPAALATAVVHGFGTRSVHLAVRTAAQLARPHPES